MPGSRPRSGCCAARRPISRPTTAPIPSPVALKERALAIEDAARAVPGITNSEGAGVSAGRTVVALATSHGFARGYTTSGYGGAASVIAGEGGAMQRDHASHNVRHYADLDAPEATRAAGRRARGEAARSGQARQRDDAGAVRSARRRQPDRPSGRAR